VEAGRQIRKKAAIETEADDEGNRSHDQGQRNETHIFYLNNSFSTADPTACFLRLARKREIDSRKLWRHL